MKTHSKAAILAIVSACFILMGLIVLIVSLLTHSVVLMTVGIILLVSSLVPAAFYSNAKLELQKEEIRSIIPSNEFVEIGFRERNDKIVDEVFKHAKIYDKISESDKNIVIVKIKIFDNEIVTELPLEELIKKSY